MIKRLILLVIMLSPLWAFLCKAVTVSSLYSVQLPVKSRSTGERNRLVSQALKSVLIRVSGNNQVADKPQIADMLKHASRYVAEFSYQEPDQDKKDESNQSLLLNINFVPNAINSNLKQAGFAVWSQARPLTLVWLVVKDQQGLKFLASDDKSDAFKLVKQYTDQRGLPVLFPLLDLADLRQVTANDVWTPFTDVVKQASKRYSPNNILIGAIDMTKPNDIVGRWFLLSEGQQMRWETDGSALNNVIQTGINNVTDVLVKQFAPTNNGNQQNNIKIVVMNLQDVTDYVKVKQYLQNLTGVSTVQTLNVSPTQADFNLTLSSDVTALKRTIALDVTLQPVASSDLDDQTQPVLKYRYKGQ